MKLRPATIDDLETLWLLRNDPVTRANSHNHDPVALEKHRAWLTAALANADVVLSVLDGPDGQPIATSRVDRHDTYGEISVTVAAGCRHRGVGTYLIQVTTLAAVTYLHLERMRAEILAHNRASLRAFEKAGYSDPQTENGVVTVWWTRR